MKIQTSNDDDECKGCERSECQSCCPHDEFDHDICLYCGYERDPGEAIDQAYERLRDGRL